MKTRVGIRHDFFNETSHNPANNIEEKKEEVKKPEESKPQSNFFDNIYQQVVDGKEVIEVPEIKMDEPETSFTKRSRL